jgi:adenylate cyclase
MSQTRRLAAILAADVAGYSRLMGADEEGTLERLKALRRELVDPKIAEHHGRIVKTTGDGMLVEFPSVVDAVRCAVDVQSGMAERNIAVPEGKRIEFRIGVNLGDIILDDDDIFGDGVNIAARLEALAEPGGICLGGSAHEQVRDKLDLAFEDMGEQQVKNIARPVRVYRVRIVLTHPAAAAPGSPLSRIAGEGVERREAGEGNMPATLAPSLPDKPSIAVLPFQNMSGDPEQEYFTDGIVEDIITELSRFRALYVIARNSTFTYKGKAVDIRQAARELGVRYVVEGSIRKAGNRVRVTAQLIDAATGNHLWAERYDRTLEDVFAVQEEVSGASWRRWRRRSNWRRWPRLAAPVRITTPSNSRGAPRACLTTASSKASSRWYWKPSPRPSRRSPPIPHCSPPTGRSLGPTTCRTCTVGARNRKTRSTRRGPPSSAC